MNTFDPASLDRLNTCDLKLRGLMTVVMDRCPFNFRIVQGARTIVQQREYFLAGKSKVNPDTYATPEALYRAAKHVVGPGAPMSRAVDVAIIGKDPYHVPSLCMLAGIAWSVSRELYVPIRLGIDFDQDGEILEVGSFIDGPHIELD